MNLSKFLLGVSLTYIFLNLAGLFLQEFNHLKVVIFINILIALISIFLFFYFSSPLFVKKEKPFDNFLGFLNFLNTPVCIYDDNMKIIYVNKAFEEFVNLKKDILVNLQLDTWITKNPIYFRLSLIFFPSLVATKVHTKLENKEVVEVNYKDEIVFDLFTIKLEINKESYNSKIIIDKSLFIKELKEKSEFISLIAHHIRTPLTQIKWFLESLMKLEKISEIDKESVKNVMNIITKSITLAESTLFFTKIEEGKLELTVENNDIEDLILSCLTLFNIEINEKKLNVNIEIDESVKKFPFDKKILFFALYPLIENSVDYNKVGGEIYIKVTRSKEKPDVIIEVKDTGIGIANRDFNHIFEKFFRSSKAKEIKPTGTGIGLYLAKNLIEFHKGTISVSSEENKGTTVVITLPAYKEVYL